MKAKWALFGWWLNTAISFGAPAIHNQIAALLEVRGCGGCHQGTTARLSMAQFTTIGGEREILKSLAYRHYVVRARVVAAFGEKGLVEFRHLKDAAIDVDPAGPQGPAFRGILENFLSNLTRDGDVISPQEKQLFEKWFAQGAPLPPDIYDEVFLEIREHLRR